MKAKGRVTSIYHFRREGRGCPDSSLLPAVWEELTSVCLWVQKQAEREPCVRRVTACLDSTRLAASQETSFLGRWEKKDPCLEELVMLAQQERWAARFPGRPGVMLEGQQGSMQGAVLTDRPAEPASEELGSRSSSAPTVWRSLRLRALLGVGFGNGKIVHFSVFFSSVNGFPDQ